MMMMNYRYNMRLYPNKEQKTLIDKTIGCCRLIYNLMLYERKQVWEDENAAINLKNLGIGYVRQCMSS